MTKHRSRRRSFATSLLMLSGFAAGTGLLTAATPVDGVRFDPDPLVVATAHWRDRAQLQQIAGRFQHVAVDMRRRTARLEVNADELAVLQRLGVRVDIDPDATKRMRTAEAAMAQRAVIARRHLKSDGTMTAQGLEATQVAAQSGIPGYACYRTVEETYATMDLLAGARPHLARVTDIGPSWAAAKSGGAQGYPMRVLRLGNRETDANLPNKPAMTVVAALHAREYTTAELVTRFAEWLVDGHGRDSEPTWLLDNFDFHFVLHANPDGRKKAESGLSWRKNTDTDNGSCSTNAYGVDLNRNFPWRFGTVPGGSSGNPCESTYRGPSASSEPEVQNILRYAIGTPDADGRYSGGVLPDRRTSTGPAPSDYRGLLLDIHSYSQLVLWPWAHTTTDAPNAGQLRTLGRRLAYFNGYRPAQWTALYAADGTITDTVYGATGAPSFTIELGQEFFEDCPTFESTTLPRNLAALRYAARNLQAPYASPSGPDTTAIGASAAFVTPGQVLAVSAWIDDARFSQANGTEAVQTVTGASAYLDAPPWAAAADPLPMRASDGAFDSSREQVVVNIDTRGLAYGRHVVYVRGTDASGRAGTPAAIHFTVGRRLPRHDFNGDGRADLFWRNRADGRNSIWLSADPSREQAVPAVAAQAWQVPGVGDFNGDGRSDLVWRNGSDGRNSIWLSGNAATPQAVAAVASQSWQVRAVGDFNGDGRSDLFWRNASDGRNSIWLSANHATPQSVATVGSQAWQVTATGDFNGDGRADLFWRNRHDGRNSIWRSGNASTPQPVATVADQAWQVQGVGDFDGDGRDDLFWRNSRDGRNSIWLSANASTPRGVASVPTQWQVVRAGDFDGDGADDLLWRDSVSGRNSVWKRADSANYQNLATVASAGWQVAPELP